MRVWRTRRELTQRHSLAEKKATTCHLRSHTQTHTRRVSMQHRRATSPHTDVHTPRQCVRARAGATCTRLSLRPLSACAGWPPAVERKGVDVTRAAIGAFSLRGASSTSDATRCAAHAIAFALCTWGLVNSRALFSVGFSTEEVGERGVSANNLGLERGAGARQGERERGDMAAPPSQQRAQATAVPALSWAPIDPTFGPDPVRKFGNC